MKNIFIINCPACGAECEASEEYDQVSFGCDVCESDNILLKDSDCYAQILAQGVANACSPSAKK